eukprot:gene17824-19605_t
MDEVCKPEDLKDTKQLPARPPPPKNNKPTHPSEAKVEKLPPKRPKLPSEIPQADRSVSEQNKALDSGSSSSIQHHLDQLRDLQKHKVRWLYLDAKKWVAFNGKDSLLIEEHFQMLNDIDKKEDKAESSDVGCGEVLDAPTVRGGLYEVNVKDRQCSSLYWKDDPVEIMRGAWFKGSPSHHDTWEPINEADAKKIEHEHQSFLRSMGMGATDTMHGESPVIHTFYLGNAKRVDWYDIEDVRLVNESTGSRIAQKIGLGGSQKLMRGWHTDAKEEDHLSDINHIIFLIHGIGQLMYHSGGIISRKNKITEATDKAIKKHFKGEFKDGRVEFFPVEWRSSLKLDEGLIEAITPGNVAGLRKVVNETTMDIMYYTSSHFRSEIIKSLREQLNSVYLKYINRNPQFIKNNGKVSVIAHSLGSVIFHDILINWNNQLLAQHIKQADEQIAAEGRWSWFWGSRSSSKEPQESIDGTQCDSKNLEQLNDDLRKAKIAVGELEARIVGQKEIEKIEDHSLRFKIENAFNIGSPLGVFLVLKGIRPREDLEQHILPYSVCSNYFNIYDPADPIAYRLEPLIYEHYAEIPPVRINQVTKSPSRATKDAGNENKKDIAAGWLKSWFSSSSPEKSNAKMAEYHGNDAVDLPKGQMEKTDDILKAKKALKNRLDYTLESGLVEYFSAITSHMAYWESQEFARFVLKTIIDNSKTISN